MPTEDAIVKFIKDVLPNVEKYREVQINKYHREKELEYGGEYSVLEKYKNRTRIVDMFLPALRRIAQSDADKTIIKID